ncbi:hypothetical protein ACQ4PT_050589 [Festuca glaucescens]
MCLRCVLLMARSFKGSSPDQMQFFSVLLKMIGARYTIEVGVFTGYSLLSTALALPADGKVVAIDVNCEYYELGRPVIEKAGVAHKVDFREGDGLAVLDGILDDEDGGGTFDFAYADADKLQYAGHHEHLLRLVRVGGMNILCESFKLPFSSVVMLIRDLDTWYFSDGHVHSWAPQRS